MDFFTDVVERFQVMESQRADDDIEALRLEFEILNRHTTVIYPERAVSFLCLMQHFFRDVDTGTRNGAMFDGIAAVPSIAAAEIQNALAATVRHHFFEGMPFALRLQALFANGASGCIF